MNPKASGIKDLPAPLAFTYEVCSNLSFYLVISIGITAAFWVWFA